MHVAAKYAEQHLDMVGAPLNRRTTWHGLANGESPMAAAGNARNVDKTGVTQSPAQATNHASRNRNRAGHARKPDTGIGKRTNPCAKIRK